MSILTYFDQMTKMHVRILDYIENYCNTEENYQNIIQLFKDQKIKTNKQMIKSIIRLLLKISNNHYRSPDFFNKMERIIQYLSEEIKQSLSNFEIFNIFKSNKRILLFLIDEKIISIDNSICKIFNKEKYIRANYSQYFLPEIQHFHGDKSTEKLVPELGDKFIEKRKIGENDSYTYELIRNDLIDEFISHVNQKDINIHDDVESSIFETHQFLINNKVSLIQYAAFFGSTQIFKYLYKNGVDLTPTLWMYAIHSQNPEIISILEESNVELEYETLKSIVRESIKCHHNEMVKYFQNKLLEINAYESECLQDDFLNYLHYYNFCCIHKIHTRDLNIYELMQYNYYIPVKILLESTKVDINQKLSIYSKSFIQFVELFL